MCTDGPSFVFKLIETNAYLLRRRIQIKLPIPAIKVQTAMLAGSGMASTLALKDVEPALVCSTTAVKVSQYSSSIPSSPPCVWSEKAKVGAAPVSVGVIVVICVEVSKALVPMYKEVEIVPEVVPPIV